MELDAGMTIEGLTPGFLGGRKIYHRVRWTLDRKPWPMGNDQMVISNGEGITSVLTDSIKVVG